ncbi:PIN domain-containing protein [Adhaeretor mobilis]|uniref:Uncharacterized protein n=1 Tax=Adhaeretor mobilis TaxID=1930276 RepID=A0A517MRX8_9BACT|nr:type II toxin-antitoxin system VapC family toxin [Adhaeretor mobilis]QDS97633.1 hypothetical protein HG15A2_08970 [Adhaeretor mobilis]
MPQSLANVAIHLVFSTKDRQPILADGLIAATVLRHGLRLMTHIVAHFKPTGVMLANPWDGVSE